MDTSTRVISFDEHDFPFAPIVRNNFNKELKEPVQDLENLHGVMKKLNIEYGAITSESSQQSVFHDLHYKFQEEMFLPLYRRFVKQVIWPLYGEPIVYQARPTFRVHLVGNMAVSEFHCDGDYNHLPQELNFWVPLTRVYDTNAVWIESTEGAADYKPHELDYGQMLIFRGVSLDHGNKPNTTETTRVSFDFRALPKRDFVQTGKTTLTQKVPLEIGGYYDVIE